MLNWNSGILPGKMGPRIIDCPKHNLGAASTITLKLRHVVLSLFRFVFKKFHCHYRVRFISRPRLSWYKLTFIFCLYTLWYSVGSFGTYYLVFISSIKAGLRTRIVYYCATGAFWGRKPFLAPPRFTGNWTWYRYLSFERSMPYPLRHSPDMQCWNQKGIGVMKPSPVKFHWWAKL